MDNGTAICFDCPTGKFQQGTGRAYCETVVEGQFVSGEPAEVADLTLKLPNTNGDLNEKVQQALIERLAVELNIDPKYIKVGNAALERWRYRRVLRSGGDGRLLGGGGMKLSIVILSEDSAAISTKLAALTSNETFWARVNENLEEKGVSALNMNMTGATVDTAPPYCNEHFEFINETQSCVAVPMQCPEGTFSAAGTGKCTTCPASKFSSTKGSFACESCQSASNSTIGASSWTDCLCNAG
jgi:hypothetical protein